MVAAGAAAYAAVEVDMWQAAYAVVGLYGYKSHRLCGAYTCAFAAGVSMCVFDA